MCKNNFDKKSLKDFLNKIDIVKIMGNFIKLNKSGENYKGLSPFQSEKTPSLVVSPKKKIWKDFSSGKSGDVVNFLMYYKNYNFLESLKYLNKTCGFDADVINNRIQTDGSSNLIKKINEKLSIIYHKLLFLTSKGLNYLKNRKLPTKIIKKFKIGYSRVNSSSLIKNLRKKFNERDLISSGNFIKSKLKLFNRFYDRIIFPIRNNIGEVIGFAGRSLINNNNKYINSPNNQIFNKSNVLYGYYESKKHIIKNKFCYLVEGYMDLITLRKVGVKNVLSSCGTSLTSHQIKIIKKITDNVILFYDYDVPGVKATIKIIDDLLKFDVNVDVIKIPFNHDPDSFVNEKKSSNNDFNVILSEHKINFINYKFYVFHLKINIFNSKFDLFQSILNSISLIKNEIKKFSFLRKLSDLSFIRLKVIIKEFNRITNDKHKNNIVLINRHNNKINLFKKLKNKLEIKIFKFFLLYSDHVSNNLKKPLFFKIYSLLKIHQIKLKNNFIIKKINLIKNYFINDYDFKMKFFLENNVEISDIFNGDDEYDEIFMFLISKKNKTSKLILFFKHLLIKYKIHENKINKKKILKFNNL